jgi:hypothetical protein
MTSVVDPYTFVSLPDEIVRNQDCYGFRWIRSV